MQQQGRGLQHVSMGTGSQEIVSHNHNSSGEKGLKVSGKELEIAPAGSSDATVKLQLSTVFWTSFGLKSAAPSVSELLQCAEMSKSTYFTSPTDLGWNDRGGKVGRKEEKWSFLGSFGSFRGS